MKPNLAVGPEILLSPCPKSTKCGLGNPFYTREESQPDGEDAKKVPSSSPDLFFRRASKAPRPDEYALPSTYGDAPCCPNHEGTRLTKTLCFLPGVTKTDRVLEQPRSTSSNNPKSWDRTVSRFGDPGLPSFPFGSLWTRYCTRIVGLKHILQPDNLTETLSRQAHAS